MLHQPITASPEASALDLLAQSILAGGPLPGRNFTAREWHNAAQWYVDTGGDDPDLAYMLAEEAQLDAFGQWRTDATEFVEFEDWRAGYRGERVSFGMHHPDSPAFGGRA